MEKSLKKYTVLLICWIASLTLTGCLSPKEGYFSILPREDDPAPPGSEQEIHLTMREGQRPIDTLNPLEAGR